MAGKNIRALRAVTDDESAEQFNAHDADEIAKEIDKMLRALADMGIGVDQGKVKSAADSQAACEILVAHGLASEAEVQVRSYRAARAIIAQVLQKAEEARLQQQRGVQVVRQPGIIVAKH